MTPYYADDRVTLYLGDCREVTEWLAADVLVTDPPYGIDDQGGEPDALDRSQSWAAISGDANTGIRDEVLDMWANMRPAVVFGSALKAPPDGARQALVWKKPDNMGIFGTVGGFRRDWECIYLRGDSLKRGGAESGVIVTPRSWETTGHRHSKPVALMERLVALFPGVIADPFAGSGSTLVAARNLGRHAIGVEIEERYCEVAARRLAQDCLDLGGSA